MFVPRQLGSSKLGITVSHDVLMSNQFSKIWCFYSRQEETVTYDTWCQGSSQFGTWQFDMTCHWWPLYNFDVPWQWPVCQCAYLVQWRTAMMHCSANIHVNCMQPIFHVTISTSFCPFDGLALSWLACSIADFYVCWELLCFVFPMFCFQSGAHYPWLALLWFWSSVQNQW